MCGYWIPTSDTERVYADTLRDAYRDGAAILLGLYKNTKGNIHRAIRNYHSSTGLPLYNTRTGKAANHWVRFSNGSNPRDGYEEVSYGATYGVASKEKAWPKDWL